jgi:uncharacterized lipoprotein NlpE involved in copper resistance
MKNKIITLTLLTGLLLTGCNQPSNATSQTSQNQSYDKVIYIPSDRYPETAEHVKEAEAKGKSSICTIDRKDVKEHRKESLARIETKQGYDRDEFPMAMCQEGGNGADVKFVSSADNRGEGSYVSHQLKGLPDGTKVKILVK